MAKIVPSRQKGASAGNTAINGGLAALAEQRVLLVDIDPQSNLTSGIGQKSWVSGTIYGALITGHQHPIDALHHPTVVDRLMRSADRQLTGAEIELVPLSARRTVQPHRLRARSVRLRVHRPSVAWPTHANTGRGRLRAVPLHCDTSLEGLTPNSSARFVALGGSIPRSTSRAC